MLEEDIAVSAAAAAVANSLSFIGFLPYVSHARVHRVMLNELSNEKKRKSTRNFEQKSDSFDFALHKLLPKAKINEKRSISTSGFAECSSYRRASSRL
jgi:hypothetical protein